MIWPLGPRQVLEDVGSGSKRERAALSSIMSLASQPSHAYSEARQQFVAPTSISHARNSSRLQLNNDQCGRSRAHPACIPATLRRDPSNLTCPRVSTGALQLTRRGRLLHTDWWVFFYLVSMQASNQGFETSSDTSWYVRDALSPITTSGVCTLYQHRSHRCGGCFA